MSTSQGRTARFHAAITQEGGLPPFLGATDLACSPRDADRFYPKSWTVLGDGVRQAKRICRRCPQRDPCLTWAVETRQDHGVWGATTPAERRRMIEEGA